MRRGTDRSVPIVPGLVRVTVAPWKSSTVSLLVLALRMSSSYTALKPAKSIVSASLMTGTTRDREPSDFSMSTASPSPTCSRRTRRGVPSEPSTKWLFITGT